MTSTAKKAAAVVGGVAILAGAALGLRAAFSKPAPAPADERQWVEVEHVRSGDTITVKPEDKVTYAGIRAPLKDEPLFEEATRRNGELVEGKKLRLRFEEDERDKKQRLLAYAFVDGKLVNEILVREGLAFVRLTPTTQRFAKQLLAAQGKARRAQRGLWSKPWTAAAAELLGDPKYGNLHTPACEEIPKIDPARLVRFDKLDDALDRGFAPCRKCTPCRWSE